MKEALEKLNRLLEMIGFLNPRVQADEEHRKISIFIDDNLSQTQLAATLSALDHLFNLLLKKEKLPPFILDLNYYRKERERIITDLARAAAKKAMMTKSDVELPPMNAYERRLVHMTITAHPELKTESIGIGRERRVVIKIIS
jgi:spoIIIJ-associated protein